MIELKNYEVKNVYGGMYYYTMLGGVLGGSLTPIGGVLMVGSEGFSDKYFSTMRNFMLALAGFGSVIGLVVGYVIDRNG